MHEENLCALAQVIPKLDESNKEYDMQHEKGHEYHKQIAIQYNTIQYSTFILRGHYT